MYNINGFYSKKKLNIEKFNNIKEIYNSVNITIDTSLSDIVDEDIIKNQIINSINDAGNKFDKFNLSNEILDINIYSDNEIKEKTLFYNFNANSEISKKDICINAGFIFENNTCYKDDNKIDEIDIEIDIKSSKEEMCDKLSKYGFNYTEGECLNQFGESISLSSDVPSNIPTNIEKFGDDENNNTKIKVTYSKFPNDSTNIKSNISKSIAKSGNIPIDSITDPILIEIPSIEDNTPIPISDPDFYLFNKSDNKDIKIVSDVTFFNKKLENISSNEISNMITAICKEMNENCEVMFFENFDYKTKGEFVIKLKNKNKSNSIKKKISDKFKELNIGINLIKIIK